MKKILLIIGYLLPVLLFNCAPAAAQDTKPDTVKVGIYITSIHDIDFKQKEYGSDHGECDLPETR